MRIACEDSLTMPKFNASLPRIGSSTERLVMKKQKPISDDSKAKNSGCAKVGFGLFGLLFMFGGLAIFYFDGLKPYLQKQQAKNWPAAECKITKADTEEHRGDDSTSYTVNFKYTFQVDGQFYSGTRYSFADENGSRREVNRQKAAFPEGSTRECNYNPQDPNDCVLDRTNQDQGWASLTLPFIFVAFGALASYLAFFVMGADDEKSISGAIKSKKSRAKYGEAKEALGATLGSSKVVSDNSADQLDAQWNEPLKLKPEASRLGRAIGIGIFALLWNGLVSMFIYFATDGLQNFGWGQIGIGLFMVPFVIIGLLMIAGAIYSIAAIFNPTVEIALSCGAVPLGGTVDVAWQVEGRFERIKKLKIHVQASQYATYQRGTDTTTDIEVFEKLLVTESTEVTDIAFGSTTITIPADSMHTFKAKRNKIKWHVCVLGNIPWSPDVKEDYEFRVTPTKTESRSS